MSVISKETTRSRPPKQTPSILFQFVLSEFLEVDQITSKIQSVIQATSTPAHWKHLLQDLIGSHHLNDFQTWHDGRGRILHLKELCTHLVEVQHSKNTHLKKLPHATQQLWSIASKCFHSSPAHHKSSWGKMSKSLLAYKNLITQAIEQFHDDENVLLFILKNHIQFDEAFGKSFVSATFQRRFPMGKSGTQEFLINRYHQRGFQKLESLIRKKIQELGPYENF